MAESNEGMRGSIIGFVTDSTGTKYVRDAVVRLIQDEKQIGIQYSGPQGRFEFSGIVGGYYTVEGTAFVTTASWKGQFVADQPFEKITLKLNISFEIAPSEEPTEVETSQIVRAVVGRPFVIHAHWSGAGIQGANPQQPGEIDWKTAPGARLGDVSLFDVELLFARSGKARVVATAKESDVKITAASGDSGRRAELSTTAELFVSEPEATTIRGNVGVTLQRTASDPTLDQALWVVIRNRGDALSFSRYREFINRVLRWEENDRPLPRQLDRELREVRELRDLGTNLHGIGAYKVLKTATEIFLLLECGVPSAGEFASDAKINLLEEQARLGEPISPEDIADRLRSYLGDPPQLPYITRVVEAAFPEFRRAASRRHRGLLHSINEPCLLELIWSYWHEEGMLMQTMNAIALRFQNIRRSSDRDPLLNMEIDPLRPVNNLLWGYIQDEPNRLSVARRGHEYVNEYGLPIYGKATWGMRGSADARSKFLEAFHNLLHQSSIFFKEDFQTTVIADGFPLLNALKEVHLILAQGANNQFGDLPWTARAEMLMSEYILSRPEIRDFLQGRVMVPYKEAWMPQVDTMKTLQGWSDVTVTHFRDLGVFGEQLLLSIRYGDWIDINDENSAKNWARYWRPEIQGYLHAYRAATGIDLTNPDTVDSTIPAVLLQKRMGLQQRVR